MCIFRERELWEEKKKCNTRICTRIQCRTLRYSIARCSGEIRPGLGHAAFKSFTARRAVRDCNLIAHKRERKKETFASTLCIHI